MNKRKWQFDEGGNGGSHAESYRSSLLATNTRTNTKVVDPPGFIAGQLHSRSTRKENTPARQEKVKNSAMATAQAPAKQLLMTAFMLYMSGTTIHIFSIITVVMALYQPVMAITRVNKVFERYESAKIELLLPKIVYVGVQFVALGMAVFKLNAMGLTPAVMSNPEATAVVKNALEHSYGSIVFGGSI